MSLGRKTPWLRIIYQRLERKNERKKYKKKSLKRKGNETGRMEIEMERQGKLTFQLWNVNVLSFAFAALCCLQSPNDPMETTTATTTTTMAEYFKDDKE